MKIACLSVVCLFLLMNTTLAQIPAPPADLADYPMPYDGTFPEISATDLLDKPAGKNGPIVVRDGHFYTGEKRIRFWGVNIAFAGNFPTHEQADAIALRLSTFGINAVRFHHMDNQVFPNGIWADAKTEKLSPEAIDRLDYFIAALAKQGVYANLNLHVSREWSKHHNWPNAEKLGYDKIIDIFHPDLIAANKQYARDLLTHVNAYTGKRYADEPSVCMVEINNEDTLFTWDGEREIAKLPEPYAGMLNKLWNDWLTKKYGSQEKLRAAWDVGAKPVGDDLLTWTLPAGKDPRDYSPLAREWSTEQHGTAKMDVVGCPMPDDSRGVQATITNVDGTDWHAQISRRIKIEKGKFYTIAFTAKSDKPTTITLSVGQGHEPWETLGLSAAVKLDPTPKRFSFGFEAIDTDDNGRITFVLGKDKHTIQLTPPTMAEGGRLGLRENENPFAGNAPVASHIPGASDTAQRNSDWFDFLQQTDEAYFVGMRDFLKNEIGVKCPITGTIGLGMLGTQTQAKMDFVDAHEYWDHPSFPHKSWDPKDWLVKNEPMVDHPERATLWSLAATRVAGKPFTVTEYNHAAPNEWTAETIPLIASFAALQDWDGVFLFAYTHNADHDKQHISGFFDIEGDPTKMPLMPLAARLFLGRDTVGAIAPLVDTKTVAVAHDRAVATMPQFYHMNWGFLHNEMKLEWQTLMNQRFAITFDPDPPHDVKEKATVRARWDATAPGTGRFAVEDEHAIVFTGFAAGESANRLQTPFASVIVVPADPTQTLATADRLLIGAVARAENTGMKRSADRTTVGQQWGKAPVRIELVKGTLTLPGGGYKAFAINPDGTRGEAIDVTSAGGSSQLPLGTAHAVWYEVIRDASAPKQ